LEKLINIRKEDPSAEWKMLKELGAGAYATVYSVENLKTG